MMHDAVLVFHGPMSGLKVGQKLRPAPRLRKLLGLAAIGFALHAVAAGPASATPSTVFWAPSTPALQPYGVLHMTYDTYFNEKALYPTTVGLTMGVAPGKTFQAEAGLDLLYPTVPSTGPLGFPALLNAKVGSPEGACFDGSPGWSVGIFGVGLEGDVTDYNICYAVVGKTFPRVGSVAVGGYYGLNENLFKSSAGADERAGVLASWFSQPVDVPAIDRIHFCWDLQSGKNVFGATGAGVYFYVTPTVDVLMGPVFFFDEDLQPGHSDWMWSVQLDMDVNLSGGGH